MRISFIRIHLSIPFSFVSWSVGYIVSILSFETRRSFRFLVICITYEVAQSLLDPETVLYSFGSFYPFLNLIVIGEFLLIPLVYKNGWSFFAQNGKIFMGSEDDRCSPRLISISCWFYLRLLPSQSFIRDI